MTLEITGKTIDVNSGAYREILEREAKPGLFVPPERVRTVNSVGYK